MKNTNIITFGTKPFIGLFYVYSHDHMPQLCLCCKNNKVTATFLDSMPHIPLKAPPFENKQTF